MKEKVLIFIYNYIGYIVLLVLFSIYLGYYGLYAFLGNKVISKISGMIFLSQESATMNIIFGTLSIIYLFYKLSK